MIDDYACDDVSDGDLLLHTSELVPSDKFPLVSLLTFPH